MGKGGNLCVITRVPTHPWKVNFSPGGGGWVEL